MRYKILTVLITILFIINIFLITVPAEDEQTWENEYGKLIVWPTTSKHLIKQKQFYKVTWYKQANNLDIAFRFDEPLTKGSIYYYNGTDYKKLNTNHITFQDKHYYVLENVHFDQYETKTGYWTYNTPINSKGKWDMFVKLSSDTWTYAYNNNRYIHLDPWWDANWLGKKKITIDHNQVPNNLKNFPILINISNDADLSDAIGYPDGRDIAFVDSTETIQFNHEIEYFNPGVPGGGGATLRAWVNVTTLSSTVDTEIYMYFNNDNCANQSDVDDTWDSDYLAVYHMEGPNQAAIDSSTWFGNTSGSGGNPQYNQDAFFGRGVDFDGNGDYLNINDHDSWSFRDGSDDGNFTIETVVKKRDIDKNPIISKWPDVAASREWFMWFTDSNPSELRLGVYDDTNNAQQQRDTGQIFDETSWNYVVGVCHNTGLPITKDDIWLYNASHNESDVGSPANGYVVKRNSGTSVTIGRKGFVGGWEYLDGIIDELRISTIVRNESWITTTYNTIWNGSDGGFYNVGLYEYIANIEGPTNFVAETDDTTHNIILSWTLGNNATHTRVEYNTVSVWSRGEGTLLYNNTGLTTTHTNTNCNTMYYYIGWSWNDTSKDWGNYSVAQNISCPGNPTNVDIIIYPTILNITWTHNTYSDNTLVVRKNNDFPTNPSDGTVLYNGSNQYYDDNTVDYDLHYYTLFSYNDSTKTYSSGYELPLTSLTINVYNESNALTVENWNIFISDEEGEEVYDSLNQNNTLVIDLNDIPTGDIVLIVNKSGYNNGVFSITIQENTAYFLDVYLSMETDTEQYFFTVVGPQTDYGYEPPIEDAIVRIRKYINETIGWGNVSIRKTSASGIISMYLVPGTPYHITITKSGYNTFYDIFIPSTIEYAEDRYHIFRLTTTADQQSQRSWDCFTCNISFTGVMTGVFNQDGNITITYLDANSSTINTHVYLYELYGGSSSLIDDRYKTQNSYTYTVSGINTSRSHYAILHFNNTATFDTTSPITINILALYIYNTFTPSDFETRIRNVFGEAPLGTYLDWLCLGISLTFLLIFGPFNVGLGVISCGFSIGLIQVIYAWFTQTMNAGLLTLAAPIILFGVFLIWTKKQEEDKL